MVKTKRKKQEKAKAFFFYFFCFGERSNKKIRAYASSTVETKLKSFGTSSGIPPRKLGVSSSFLSLFSKFNYPPDLLRNSKRAGADFAKAFGLTRTCKGERE
ncbi:MAG: hypothetical protein A2Y57_03350 [Candidatus Woykebacteria bacterium RBG_13_40_7b]|uniref:Uncharacterized protein n=1 Tax=Candidatus Woykebacteria bacterium RBG_13_40_7b TaxID=1802594 RepID=A0A1G1W9K2_9BACT|nr:MAG: hypothetical protein A2Y57_03350 [Candidatus Woykebacteria bacterium RBG_13_40_7b]